MLFDSVMQPAEADAVPGLPGMFVLIKVSRNQHYQNHLMRDPNNHIVVFSQDQHGPRIIQKKMKLDSSEQKLRACKSIPSEGQLQIVPELYGLVISQIFCTESGASPSCPDTICQAEFTCV
uniref:Maternal protein pumilio n=1 Tax=Culex pipiens TaxID=7175 RepID=A0A8D8H953_CULPI